MVITMGRGGAYPVFFRKHHPDWPVDDSARARTEAALLASYARIVLIHPKPLDRVARKSAGELHLRRAARTPRRGLAAGYLLRHVAVALRRTA